jgi:membrane protein implicated in regulation of membrane protease activity
MNNPSNLPESTALTAQHAAAPQQGKDTSRKILIWTAIGAIVVLALLIVFIVFLLQPTTNTALIRDIFIIFLALESLLIGAALVILIVQIAMLINLLQNEIKPILDSTNETVSNLRGTTTFLSDNLVEPVIKLNEYLAGLTQAIRLVGLARRKPKQ